MKPDQDEAGSGGRPPRIIIADDHEWIRQVLVGVALQTVPAADIFETEDGLKAFEVFQREGCDFLVTNHCMPHMNGMTLIRQVRKRAPELPILMVSVHPDARQDAMAAGADWFLMKEQIMEHMPGLLLSRIKTPPEA